MINIQGFVYTSKIYNNKVVIPKDLREHLEWSHGDVVIWEVKGPFIHVRKSEEEMGNIQGFIYTSKIYKNKVVILKDLRKRLKLNEGDSIIWEIRNGILKIRKNVEKKTF